MLTGFRDKEFISASQKYGIENSSQVSKDTFAVLVKSENDLQDDTTKLLLAKKYNIPVMTLNGFNEKYEISHII